MLGCWESEGLSSAKEEPAKSFIQYGGYVNNMHPGKMVLQYKKKSSTTSRFYNTAANSLI